MLDLHQSIDGLEEVELGKGSIGTTRKGIGPTYSTKMTRSGVRMTDMLDHERLETRLRAIAHGFTKRYGDLLEYNVEDELTRLKARISPRKSQLTLQVLTRTDLYRQAETIHC